MKPLLTLLKTDPAEVDALSVEQVLMLCGKTKLSDNSESSANFRSYLKIASSKNLRKYVSECIHEPFDGSGFVLQDLVNEFGRRLDYDVESGLYRGRSDEIGFDGLWLDRKGHHLVVEVKTTDAYRISLATLAGYRDALCAAGRADLSSSILIVVGRESTGELEAQVRGSQFAWITRIISVDGLSKLVELKETTEQGSIAKIHDLLRPFEYTKLDSLIDIAFGVAAEASSAVEDEQVGFSEIPESSTNAKQQHTATEQIDTLRTRLLEHFALQYEPLVRASRALYSSPDKSIRVAISVSKKYANGNYWYAYRPDWDEYLSAATKGFYVLGCVGSDEAFAIPYAWIHERLSEMNVTFREDGTFHYHVQTYPEGRELLMVLKGGRTISIEQFRFTITNAQAQSATAT